jgi:hypothetical protein
MKRRLPKNKFAFLHRMLADTTLSPAAKIVATTLLFKFHNTKTGQCNPSIAAIGKSTGRGNRSVFRDILELVAGSWITVESTKGGSSTNTNHYKFNFERVPGVSPLPVSRVSSLPVSPVSPVPNIDVGVPLLADEQRRTTRASSARVCEDFPASACAPSALALEEEKFQQLCFIWEAKPHGVNIAKARKAFLAVCAGGVSPDVILASAQNWVAKTAEPRYLKKLEEWLGDGVWRKEPSSRTKTRPGGKQSLVAIAREYGGV